MFNFLTEPKAPTERTDPQCIARPSPFKVNGDQSTDGGSGHGALPYMPTAPSVNGRGKALLTDGGVVFAEASVSQSNRFAGFFPHLPACCEARLPDFPLSSIVRARVASQCLNLHTRSDWMTDPSLLKKLNIFQLFDGAEGSNGTDGSTMHCASVPMQSQWDQSTDGGSGHEALKLLIT